LAQARSIVRHDSTAIQRKIKTYWTLLWVITVRPCSHKEDTQHRQPGLHLDWNCCECESHVLAAKDLICHLPPRSSRSMEPPNDKYFWRHFKFLDVRQIHQVRPSLPR